MTLEEHKQLLDLAMRFYTSVESPSDKDIEVVFDCLITNNPKRLEEFVRLHGVFDEDEAYTIHEAEAERGEAEFYNEGWGVSSDNRWISIASKTSKGILQTNVDFSTDPPTVEHDWKS